MTIPDIFFTLAYFKAWQFYIKKPYYFLHFNQMLANCMNCKIRDSPIMVHNVMVEFSMLV